MEERIIKIAKRFSQHMKNIYGSNLKRVLIYGSYARGDYHNDSDLDLAVIVDTPVNEIVYDKNTRDKIIDFAGDLIFETGLNISPTVINEEMLEKRAAFWPFYSNVKNEGVDVNEL